MSVAVGEVSRSAHTEYLGLLLVDGLQDAGVEDRGFSAGVDTNQKDHISVLNHFNLGVEQIVGPEVVGQGEAVGLSELVVEGVEGVEKIFEGLDVLHTLELADPAGDILAVHFVNPRSYHRQGVLPILLREVCAFPQ